MCHAELRGPVAGGSGLIEQQVTIPVAGVDLPAMLVAPEGDSLVPGVVIVHDIWGAGEFYHDLARRLAGEGFLAILPDFFTREGALAERDMALAGARRERMSQQQALDDIGQAVAWLAEQSLCNEQVGVIGFCMGGTLALLAAARDPLPAATVAFYGFPAGHGAWPLRPIDDVANLRSPVLALWGDGDHGVGMDNVEAYRAAVEAAGADYRQVIYPGIPHGFLTFDPASPNYDAATQAWDETLGFLRDRLQS